MIAVCRAGRGSNISLAMMNGKKIVLPVAGFLFLALCVFLVSILSLSIGEVPIPMSQMADFLNQPETMEYGVLWYIRIPRTILAIAIGGGLSLSGVILQGIYRNPLVEPYTLGISGGASLGITFAIISGLYAIHSLLLPLFGFAGAFATIFLVYTLSMGKSHGSVNRMLLIGVMISFISSAIVMFLMSVTSVENLPGIIFWTMGSLNESDMMLITGMSLVAFLVLGLAYLFVPALNALRLGESRARYLGVNTQYAIRMLFVLTSLLTGTCIAVAGVIGFVGLIIPHFTRLWVGTDYKYLLGASFLSGSVFLVLCDIVARTVVAPNELPIGVITGMAGGIAFIFILSSRTSKSKIL